MPTTNHPDIILYNGVLAGPHRDQPIIAGAQAAAISRGTLLAVGKNTDVLHLAGPATEKIDLQGRLLVPGFA
ncbi:MAG: hypothetical protein V2I36_18075, partial [Desulfopila sp.]|nr:hypothetical protein [Desulfopila sp.]